MYARLFSWDAGEWVSLIPAFQNSSHCSPALRLLKFSRGSFNIRYKIFIRLSIGTILRFDSIWSWQLKHYRFFNFIFYDNIISLNNILLKKSNRQAFLIHVFGFYKNVEDWRLYVWSVSWYTWKAEDSCQMQGTWYVLYGKNLLV